MRYEPWKTCAVLAALLVVGCNAPPPEGGQASAPRELPTIDLSGGPAFPLDAHLEQADVMSGSMSFEQLFEAGSDLFHTPLNGHDGIGSLRLADGSPIHRFSTLPPGGGAAQTQLSSQSCGSCHNFPFPAAAGLANTHVIADGNMDGKPPFSFRSTISTFGDGLLQLLAEEITEDLQGIRDETEAAAKASPGETVTRDLESKGISYGTIAATADDAGTVSLDLSGVEGVDPDLVVRPILVKGNITTVRTINVGASANLMGLQAEELVWRVQDGVEAQTGQRPPADLDGDGVERELSVGDVTAMTVYGAAQETPQSVIRLAELGLVAEPSATDVQRITQGRKLFDDVGCSSCHMPELHLGNTVFEEPTKRGNGNYFDPYLAEHEPGYDPEHPLSFDLATMAQEPRVETDPEGGATVRLYGDLKRHDMGRQLADPGPQPPITPALAPLMMDGEMVLIGASEFLTSELWGVGNTGPYLHDDRAATLDEAIRWHGEDDPPAVGDPGRSEAQEERDAYLALPAQQQEMLRTFLRSLQTFSLPDQGD